MPGCLGRAPSSGQNGLALREQEGGLSLDPQKGVCLVSRAVAHGDLLRRGGHWNAQRLPDEGALWPEFKLDGLSIHLNGLDVQASTVQQHALGILGQVEVVRGCGVNLS